MRYEQPPRVDRDGLNAALSAGDVGRIVTALVGVVVHDPDPHWVRSICLDLLDHPSGDIRRCAAIGLGHLVRMHRGLDTDDIVTRLRAVVDDPEAGNAARDSLLEIHRSLP
ncbi:hypothetical protein J4H86_02005 [Spiractinospora alimapuensis]|uniref:hypothetical protein n=1 Tax=Spiractinospora alimapuensis TaxID=2820884 RepID=UPI001F22BD23|nr:hypothetical protein [Spiractinospora alimapuensis]QVQ52635.1 hypothetical protein J4H86_02005 [Spiractinospora alimapuensis]